MKIGKFTKSFYKHLESKKRITVSQGSTSSSKSYSIVQMLIIIATKHPKTLTSIVMESRPALKKSVVRDLKNILGDFYDTKLFHQTDLIYTFSNGSQIEFFGADEPSKLKGPRRDYLFIDEVNNVKFEAYNQLEVRTKNRIFNTRISAKYFKSCKGIL
jgi:phage terminase large subunit